MTQKYEAAVKSKYVNKPMACALYCAWKEFEKNEKPRKMDTDGELISAALAIEYERLNKNVMKKDTENV